MQQVTSPTAGRAVAFPASRGVMAASAVTLGLLAALHVLSPELDPAWRMVSEYALGGYGWVLALLFVAWALSCALTFFVVKPHIRTRGGKIGMGLLLVAALGMGMAAVFDVTHSLHGLAAIIGMPSLPVAALLVSRSLRRNPAWVSARGVLLWTAQLPWLSLVAMFATVLIGLAQTGGEFGPGVPAGWPNRLLFVAYCGWMVTVAWLAEQRTPAE